MSQGITADYMREWSKHTHGSPLYRHLANEIADDAALLRVMSEIEHRPPPNVLLAAVQYLLMGGASPGLAAFYPSLTEEPRPPKESGPLFRAFVLANEREIIEIGRTRYTQTNECRRCVALLPLLMMAPFDRFHLVDVGTSAGLNLAIDRYGYRYDGVGWGPDSDVLLKAEARGDLPIFHDIEILSRTGLDVNPLDPSDEDHRRWLDALIWPEHAERRVRLNAALEQLADLDISLVEGDALERLGGVLADLPEGEPALVMNSFALIQLTESQRHELEEIADEARASRSVFRASMELLVKRDAWAVLSVDDGSGMRQVGEAHPHGEWVEIWDQARP